MLDILAIKYDINVQNPKKMIGQIKKANKLVQTASFLKFIASTFRKHRVLPITKLA